VYTRDRDHFVVAHAFLRSVLGAELALDPAAVGMRVEDAGKPRLADAQAAPSAGSTAAAPELHFNLTHSGGLALCAVSWGRRVGIDIEAIRPLARLDDLIRRVCGPAERADLRRLEPERRLRTFLQTWTRKEAYVKMTGAGLGSLVRVDTRDSAGRWQVRDLAVPAGYVAALAAEGRAWRVTRRSWPGYPDGGPKPVSLDSQGDAQPWRTQPTEPR
jgi:4'-phosphopantetheinyl transferase